MLTPLSNPDQLWIVVTGFVISFVLAFGIGANDVANSFGTSVGAKVLTLKQACVLATIFEIAGSLLLGAKVSDTIRKGIIDPELYANDSSLLLIGLVAALGGSCLWLLIATFARVPVSGTHSIVGATVGFSLVAKGFSGVRWEQLALIVASWFASPVLSAFVSIMLFFSVQRFILNKNNPLEYGLRALPFIYGVTIVTNLFSIFHDGPPLLHFHVIPIWGAFVASFSFGLLCSVVIKFLVVPWQRVKIRKYCEALKKKQEKKEREEQEKAAEEERRRLEAAEQGELQEGTEDSGLASEQAGLLGGGSPRKGFLGKLKAKKARKRAAKNAAASNDNPNPKLADSGVRSEHTPSESCRSLVLTSSDAAAKPSQVDEPLASSCTQLTTNSTNCTNNVRSTSTSKLETTTSSGCSSSAATPKASRGTSSAGKSGKFRVERIEQNQPTLTTSVRSACTSTTSIFREAAKASLNEAGEDEAGEDEAGQTATASAKEDAEGETDAEVEIHQSTCCCGRVKCKAVQGANKTREVVDSPQCARLFSFLQILTAIFGAFAHGGNDVSNAIGPLIGIWITATTGSVAKSADTPWWILIYGGAGISAGLWVWGRRVIQTLGEDLTKVTPSSGFCIELGAALTVLVASNAKLPISTTHCKVGSVVGVGRFRSRDNVDWRVFRNIILAWFVTVPASAALGAGIMFGLMQISLLISPPGSNSSMGNSTIGNFTNGTLF